MALGIIIAVVVIAILAVIMLKMYKSTSKTSYFGEPSRCQVCGRKGNATNCPFCKSDSKSLR
ncbi:MAG: hypothetical protein H2B00_04755 [Nitrosopumilaceae archaeon]|jgi:preprotein translocase subunit SecG|uniref:Uncharacterized protein n=1 Tax=Candidatus Nitrosomaritimum aestuariumsis TaxID=3342354 RepID=A0AC60W8Y9_9ARCH|nr:hypothetical protein [Nitrosopumilaceae archaeon]MBA4463892.1 hypothetical protein [Nitrosopumilaceae archaeon]